MEKLKAKRNASKSTALFVAGTILMGGGGLTIWKMLQDQPGIIGEKISISCNDQEHPQTEPITKDQPDSPLYNPYSVPVEPIHFKPSAVFAQKKLEMTLPKGPNWSPLAQSVAKIACDQDRIPEIAEKTLPNKIEDETKIWNREVIGFRYEFTPKSFEQSSSVLQAERDERATNVKSYQSDSFPHRILKEANPEITTKGENIQIQLPILGLKSEGREKNARYYSLHAPVFDQEQHYILIKDLQKIFDQRKSIKESKAEVTSRKNLPSPLELQNSVIQMTEVREH
ncbi:hypothetical protein SAMN05444392_10196 [Seinonella peptonophila]|uniref:Uncharacterized protein n=1 Tax=Seinonella peptonophila TaxID=112248 RepID=A0A1M4SR09_9BACL|nr:hypothetical protein [Seinonella peptonophila]SHE34650.1 hypothetical protein SAMN05444392_10196 [Seinonella peptonophila]